MKRIGNIFDHFASKDNIWLALANARKGKSHYNEVKAIERNPQAYVDHLHAMLTEGRFKNSPYVAFEKKSGDKIRQIKKVPYYPDRIVHHCIVQTMQKTWIRSLIRDTFSTIPGRGIHDGVRRIKEAMKDVKGTQYALKLDVKKYFPSIDNDILKQIIRKKIKDKRFLAVFDEIIDSAQGIPIGNYVSQWFGNLYLAYFDHWAKEDLGCKYYYRYCDDLVLLGPDKQTLWAWLPRIRQYLIDELKLEINDSWQVFPVDARGLDFMGYRFFHGYTLVRKRVIRAMKRNLHKPKSKTSYYGWIIHADHYRLKQKYFINEKYAQ